MTELAKPQTSKHYFPLTLEERLSFGWDPDQVVMSTRTPCGQRTIPTRQLNLNSEPFYGGIVTSEPPPGISEKLWNGVLDEFSHDAFCTH